jgi:hypothetical protein
MSSIITADDLTNYLSDLEIDPSLAGTLSAAANQIVESRTNRYWGGTVQVTEHKWVDPIVYVDHVDLDMSPGSLTILQGLPYQEDVTVDASTFWWTPWGEIRPQIMFLMSPVVFIGPMLQITYTHGVQEVPDDLKAATLAMAGGFYRWAANAQQDVIAAQIDTWRVQLIDSVRGTPGAPDAQDEFAVNHAKANLMVIDGYAMTRIF